MGICMNNYFPHDSNARNSDKVIKLRMKHKAAGYGVYFMIIERLRDCEDYTSPKDYNVIAYDLREDAALIKSVIEDFGLFTFTDDGKAFYSEELKERMSIKDSARKKMSDAGKRTAEKRWGKIATLQDKDSHLNSHPITTLIASPKGACNNKSKGKEIIKENNSKELQKKSDNRFSPPTLEEIKSYIQEKGYSVDAERFFDFYESKGWYVGKNKMKDWKAAIRTWTKRENNTTSYDVGIVLTDNSTSKYDDEWDR